MPLGLQAKLLRVLQEREVERVGGKKPVPLDIRILATSNRDMAAEVKCRTFPRGPVLPLNVFPLEIPSLRERPGDIVPLARKTWHILPPAANRAARFAAGAEPGLQAHAWPGNVRELENVVQRALILDAGDVIDARCPCPCRRRTGNRAGRSLAAPASAPIAVPPAPTPHAAASARRPT
jgi:two-component system response regulator FlrC